MTEFAKWVLSASVTPEHVVLSEEASPSGFLAATLEDAEVEVGEDVGDDVCADDATVVETLGMSFTATPGLTLKSLPSSALHVFSVGLPHQNIEGLSAPSPSLHG